MRNIRSFGYKVQHLTGPQAIRIRNCQFKCHKIERQEKKKNRISALRECEMEDNNNISYAFGEYKVRQFYKLSDF